VRIQRITDQKRRYMRLAELGQGPHKSGGVAAKLGRWTSKVSMMRQRFIDKGLVYATQDYAHVDFTARRFDELVRRHMAYGAPSR
jgi:hypothetical protein